MGRMNYFDGGHSNQPYDAHEDHLRQMEVMRREQEMFGRWGGPRPPNVHGGLFG